MANVIFYSTGEIFWVSDPPANRREHIGIPTVFPPVPSDEFFSYAMVADTLRDGGHRITGAWGRQRLEVRRLREVGNFRGDPMFLALGDAPLAENTVLILITTETGTPAEGGVDIYPRIPFTKDEVKAFQRFRERGGGVYVTWDHGQLGYESLRALGLEGPVEPEPDEPLRPNTAHSNDSTDSPKIVVRGRRRTPKGDVEEDVALSAGPPAGYLQKIVPAQLLYRDDQNLPTPSVPHPIFNGVGGRDGIWIPAHMHEGILKVKIVQLFMDERRLPKDVKTLAVHIPLNETSFNSFAVLAIKEAEASMDSSGKVSVKAGAIIWDTSFHHLVDINWASDGVVPWEPFVPFSAEGLWHQQFDRDIFDRRMAVGMKRLIVNAISWLGNEMAPPAPPGGKKEARQAAAPGPQDVPF